MNNKTIIPFVKWAGGKRQLINKIKELWPKNFNVYYEPFVGGGAVLFHFKPKKAIINDLNTELINLYKVIANKSSYLRLREYLILMEHGHHVVNIFDKHKQEWRKKSPFYSMIASIDRNEIEQENLLSLKYATKELRAARFLFLNKNCFNGLYRVNSKGYYNVPSKHNPTRAFNEENIKNISDYLSKNVIIKNTSFYKVVKNAQINDFVYFDPPYDYENNEKGFDSYQKDGFGTKGQIKLAKLCKKLNSKGIKFMISNHDTKLINDLYKEFKIKKFYAKRLIGGKGADRKPVKEVLITNYEN